MNEMKKKREIMRNTHTYPNKTHKNTRSETIVYRQNTSKTEKKKPQQNNMRQNVYKNELSFFMLAVCYWARLPLSVVKSGEIQLEKTK